MAKKPETLKAKFKFVRSTKGTHVFSEVDDKGEEVRNIVGSIYVQRSALKGEPPESINVTIEA